MEKNSKFNRPSGIVSSQVVVGSNPPALPNYTTPTNQIQTHLFIKGTQPTTISTEYFFPEVEEEIIEDETIIEELPINVLP